MSWFSRLFQAPIELNAEDTQRLAAWRALPAVAESTLLADLRFQVVDVESSGLNPHRDRLLAIAAATIDKLRLHPSQGFDVILHGEIANTRENILIHGIGPQAEAAGEAPKNALLAFLDHAGKNPLVAFHAPFDKALVDRLLDRELGVRLLNPWLDLALLGPALFPEAQLPRGGLDDWLGYFGLRALRRHRAADDAFASAELLLILLNRARKDGDKSLNSLLALCERQARIAPI